jgi:prepilin signal peptidase PulO-like enzyme (type II secretory pathway)
MSSFLMSNLYTVISAFVIGLFFFLLTKIKDGKAMGGGDVKLAFLIGLFNGFPYNVLAIFLGFLFGSVFSLGLILMKRKTVKDTVPFGPFLILGSVVALIWGSQIIDWYINLY